MYERFSDAARKIMHLAGAEAKRLNHEYVGTEHLLLGLTAEENSVAGHVLGKLGVKLTKIRREVMRLIQSGPDPVGEMPRWTPRVHRVVEYALEEARTLNHDYIGSEHILLGLLRDQDGVGGVILTNMGLKLDQARAQVVNVLWPQPH